MSRLRGFRTPREKRIEKMANGYPEWDVPYFPKILHGTSFCLVRDKKGRARVGLAATTSRRKYIHGDCGFSMIGAIRAYDQTHFDVPLSELPDPLPRNTVAISIAQPNFDVSKVHEFAILEGASENGHYTFKRFSPNVQATFYNADDQQYLAGVTYYPDIEGVSVPFVKSDQAVILMLRESALLHPSENRETSRNRYSRFCERVGRRVLIERKNEDEVYHIDFNHHLDEWERQRCEECLVASYIQWEKDYLNVADTPLASVMEEQPTTSFLSSLSSPLKYTREMFLIKKIISGYPILSAPYLPRAIRDLKINHNFKPLRSGFGVTRVSVFNLIDKKSHAMIEKVICDHPRFSIFDCYDTRQLGEVVAFSMPEKNFKVGASCQEFKLLPEFKATKDSYYSYQRLSENLQATYFTENRVQYLAGLCYYAVRKGKARLIENDYALITSIKYTIASYKGAENDSAKHGQIYGKHCETTGRRVMVGKMDGKRKIRHFEYNHWNKKWEYYYCEECVIDYYKKNIELKREEQRNPEESKLPDVIIRNTKPAIFLPSSKPKNSIKKVVNFQRKPSAVTYDPNDWGMKRSKKPRDVDWQKVSQLFNNEMPMRKRIMLSEQASSSENRLDLSQEIDSIVTRYNEFKREQSIRARKTTRRVPSDRNEVYKTRFPHRYPSHPTSSKSVPNIMDWPDNVPFDDSLYLQQSTSSYFENAIFESPSARQERKAHCDVGDDLIDFIFSNKGTSNAADAWLNHLDSIVLGNDLDESLSAQMTTSMPNIMDWPDETPRNIDSLPLLQLTSSYSGGAMTKFLTVCQQAQDQCETVVDISANTYSKKEVATANTTESEMFPEYNASRASTDFQLTAFEMPSQMTTSMPTIMDWPEDSPRNIDALTLLQPTSSQLEEASAKLTPVCQQQQVQCKIGVEETADINSNRENLITSNEWETFTDDTPSRRNSFSDAPVSVLEIYRQMTTSMPNIMDWPDDSSRNIDALTLLQPISSQLEEASAKLAPVCQQQQVQCKIGVEKTGCNDSNGENSTASNQWETFSNDTPRWQSSDAPVSVLEIYRQMTTSMPNIMDWPENSPRNIDALTLLQPTSSHSEEASAKLTPVYQHQQGQCEIGVDEANHFNSDRENSTASNQWETISNDTPPKRNSDAPVSVLEIHRQTTTSMPNIMDWPDNSPRNIGALTLLQPTFSQFEEAAAILTPVCQQQQAQCKIGVEETEDINSNGGYSTAENEWLNFMEDITAAPKMSLHVTASMPNIMDWPENSPRSIDSLSLLQPTPAKLEETPLQLTHGCQQQQDQCEISSDALDREIPTASNEWETFSDDSAAVPNEMASESCKEPIAPICQPLRVACDFEANFPQNFVSKKKSLQDAEEWVIFLDDSSPEGAITWNTGFPSPAAASVLDPSKYEECTDC